MSQFYVFHGKFQNLNQYVASKFIENKKLEFENGKWGDNDSFDLFSNSNKFIKIEIPDAPEFAKKEVKLLDKDIEYNYILNIYKDKLSQDLKKNLEKYADVEYFATDEYEIKNHYKSKFLDKEIINLLNEYTKDDKNKIISLLKFLDFSSIEDIRQMNIDNIFNFISPIKGQYKMFDFLDPLFQKNTKVFEIIESYKNIYPIPVLTAMLKNKVLLYLQASFLIDICKKNESTVINLLDNKMAWTIKFNRIYTHNYQKMKLVNDYIIELEESLKGEKALSDFELFKLACIKIFNA